MPSWLSDLFAKSTYFMPHGHCYLWIPSLLWMHVISDTLIGLAYIGISIVLYLLVRKIRLPFSPIFIAFGLFIGLCGVTHFMSVWTVWNPDYFVDGLVKAATAAASVATAIGLFYIRSHVEEVVHTARLSEQRRVQLEATHAELQSLYQKIKDLSEQKTHFFANVSHELRTPLALILGPAERLLSDPALSAEHKRQAASISRNGKALLKQVNDLLDVVALEDGQMPIRYVRFDLVPWLERTTSQFELAAEQRQITYKVEMPQRLEVEADPDMLERILLNLLSNAFKFTPSGGKIGVELRQDDQAFILSVSDTGPGIDPQHHKVIFERFRQVDSSATRKYGGTGLGLSIAKDFVDLHRGSIEVESEAGAGTRLQVRIPLRADGSVQADHTLLAPGAFAQIALQNALNEAAGSDRDSRSPAAAPKTDQPTVLLVEDTPEVRDFIADTLGLRYNVVTAADGREGLAQALSLRPDLIVTDLMMPNMSGDQMIAELRQHPELQAVPVLLLTAKSDDDMRVRLLQTGAQDYLTKPFLPQELLARTSNLLAVKLAGDAMRRELASASTNLGELANEISAKHRQLRAALEAAEVAREQAEKASQVKSQFLAMISHEMRTPLSTIHMNAELLSRQQETISEAGVRTRLDRTVRASQQLSTLIEGLLEYTRVESGRITAHPELVDTLALAREVLDVNQAQVLTPEVTLQLAEPPKDLPLFQTDPRLLRVVLNNLISNALKFTHKGSVTLRLAQQEHWRIFEVQDTGIGIAEEDISRIFLPFEQLEPIQRKSIPGVGLGLSLTKEIAETLNGKVEVISQKGQGSIFRVLLPDQQQQPSTGSLEEINL